MATSVRMSEIHNSDNDLHSPNSGVNALRRRFEQIGQSDDNLASGGRFAPELSSSPPRKPSTPPARRTAGPARPPPPRPFEKPKRFSANLSSPSAPPPERSVTPTVPGERPSLGESRVPHPLTKSSRSRSVGDLKVVKTETAKEEEVQNGSATAEDVDKAPTKKAKKGKQKDKSKNNDTESSSSSSSSHSGKKFLNFHKKSKSSDAHASPKPSPVPGKSRKFSAPAITESSPQTSSKKEHLAPTPESPSFSSTSSEAGSSKEGTPIAGRRKSGSTGKKEAVKKSESSQGEVTSGDTKIDKKALKKTKSSHGATGLSHDVVDKAEVEMLGTSPYSSPAMGKSRRKRALDPSETEIKREAKNIRMAVLKAGKDMTAAKLEPILNKRLALLTDGMEQGRHPIVMIMEWSLTGTDSATGFEDLKTTMSYFKVVLRNEALSAGVTLVIDARDSKHHKHAKHLLERLENEDMPLSVHMIYLIIKTGFLGFGRKTLVSAESATNLHLAYISEPRQLVEQLGAENVLIELGGSLIYQHTTWCQNRMQYEKVVHHHKKAMIRLPETKKALSSFSMPSTVKDAEQLMQDELEMKEKLINLFSDSEIKMDQLLATLNEQQSHAPSSLDLKAMISSVGDMMMEVKDGLKDFEGYWKVHRSHVEHMMRMCHFQRSGEKLNQLMLMHVKDLTEEKSVLGDTLESSLEQGEKHEAFAEKCLSNIEEQMTKLKHDASELCNPEYLPHETEAEMHAAMQAAVKAIKTQLQEHMQTYQKLANICQKKRDLYIVCVKFHNDLIQLQQWNDDTMELLASQPLEEPTPSAAINLLSNIEQCHMSLAPSHVDSLTELATTLGTKQFKKKSDDVVKKYESARSLLEQRKTFLQKILSSHFPRPTAPASPIPSLKDKTPERGGVNETDVHLQVTPDRRSLTSIVSTCSSEGAVAGDYQDLEKDAGVLKSRQFVYKELVATEQDYIKDLSTVIDSYYDEMDPESLSIPLRLRGKREVVFGNLLEIKTFHDKDFSKALEKYAECPQRIGECFSQHSAQFQLYSIYCKNRGKSETLINESTESQAFFKGIQMKLGHALHLNSYLLKPIQRITKYQLLLKDMIKHTAQAKRAHSDLQVALESMLKVLKNLNDSLHVLGVKGFPGSLAEQGRLLVHDPFQVSDNSGRFARLRERHVFLFEKVVIVSKKVEANPQQKKQKKGDSYIYKDHIQMAIINLRDAIDRHGLQFQITIHGQNKTYTFQAASKEVREMWTTEIRRLLQTQFSLMKDMVMQSGTLDRRGKSRPGGISRDSRLFGDSFRAPGPRGAHHKRSLAGRIFNRTKKTGKRPETSRSGRKQAVLEPSASLPAGLTHSARPTHSLTPFIAESETGEDKSDSISSDEELPFSSDEEDGLTTNAVDHYESLAPGAPRYYTATTDYKPGASDNEVQLTSGQEIEVIGINKYGWWWVRATNHYSNEKEEGWVPASYLTMSPDQSVPGPDSLMPARWSALRKRT